MPAAADARMAGNKDDRHKTRGCDLAVRRLRFDVQMPGVL
jgi:hypothetical protein